MFESILGISEDLAIKILTVYDNFFTKSDFFINCARLFGWWFINGLAYIVGKLENVVNSVTFITDFFDSESVNALIDKFKPLLGLILVFSIIFIGYQLMLNKKYDRSKIPMNVILAICVVVALPIAMTKINELTGLVMGEVKGSISMTKQIVSNNVTDLYLLDKADFPMKDGNVKDIKVKNNMGDNILNINVNEDIDRGKVKGKNKVVFENEVFRDKDGNPSLTRINGLFKWDDEYYRFSINFFTIICTLIITAFVLIFTAVKIVKLSIELAFSKVMTIFVAVADLSGGQKLRQSLNGIISIFVSIFATTLMLKLYILATAFFTNKLNSVATIVAMLGSAIFVIDGPNYIEKIFGVDAGLSSAWRAVTGLNSALDIMNKLGKVAGGALGKMKDLGAGALGATAFSMGMANGGFGKSLEDEMDKENSNNENDTNNNETLDSQMDNEANSKNGDKQVNEDIDSKDGDNSVDNNIDNPNNEEDLSDNVTSLDDDIENEQSNYNDEDLNNSDDIDNSQPSLEDDISEENSNENNIDGNSELNSESDNSIDGSNNQSLEDEINSESSNSVDGRNEFTEGTSQFDEGSWAAFDDMGTGVDYGVNDGSSDGLGNGIENNPGENIKDEDIKNTNIPNENLGAENIQDETINSNIPNESGKENIENPESKNDDIGYKNPIEDRNIFQIKGDKFKSKIGDFGIKLENSYRLGENTGRDIRKFVNKKKKGDKK
ncbi:hypothetical protein QJR26_09590 [Clostridium baratii]